MIEALQAKIGELESDLSRISKTAKSASASTKNTTLVPKDAAKAQSTFNGLNMSIQQIAREMPSLAMGPQMFFLAISNNLPIFADQVKYARMEYEALTRAGQKATPVWKQILKSLFSWQTALATGIMLLVMYGKEIGNWISGLFGATDAVEQNREALERRLEVEKQANAEALKTQFNIRATMAAIERFNGTKDEERRKVEELNTKYGETFGYYDTLSEWYDTLKSKAEEYVRVMFMQAKAQSLISAAVKADEKVKEIEAIGPEEYRPFFGKGGKLSMFFGGSRFNQYGSDAAEIEYRKALDEQKKIRDEALTDAEFYQNSIQRIQEESGINHVVEGSVKDLENTIALKRKALKDLTNKADYDAALAEIKVYEDKLEAITGGKKKTGKAGDSDKSKTQSLEKLSDMELAARQRVEEQVVELMKEGYDKQRAEAELNFQKEKQRIDKEEQERLALYDKLKASGAQVSPADRLTITAQAATQRVQAAQLLDNQLAEIDKKEEEDNRKKLEKLLGQYQDYAAQREAIERKHNTAIESLRSQLSSSRLEAIGFKTVLTSEPTGSRYGKRLRELLKDSTATPEQLYSLFVADRKQHLEDIRALPRDTVVICDRYKYSTYCYQTAHGMDPAKMSENNRLDTPDITFVLEASVPVLMSRISVRNSAREIYETEEFLTQISSLYASLENVFGERFVRLDATKSPEELTDIAASLCLLLSSLFGIPVSTTHTKTSAIMGVGASRRLSAINFSVVKDMVLTWIFTFPGCGLISFIMAKLFMLIF